jgi:hypothetical protein
MSGLNRDEFIELGVSIPASFVTEWANGQIAATQGRESRLEMRGMSAAYLSGIRDLAVAVGRRKVEMGDSHELPPEAAALAERIRVEAMGYWREGKRLAGVAFAAQPDVLAKFRTGVQTGLLIGNLIKELETMVVLLKEHAMTFAALGAGDGFIARGEQLIPRLRQAKAQLDATCKEFPPTVAQQCHDKGLLYDLTRRLVRVGRLEFTLEPDQAAAFNFKQVRRERGVSMTPKLKKAKTASH